jgi:hypothetical protein
MAMENDPIPPAHEGSAPSLLEFGGLRFEVSFRDVGATLRVDGRVGDGWTEMLRFDDFVDSPHFHAPASGDSIAFDRTAHGEPLAWYVEQIQEHLPEWLERSGFADVLTTIDVDEVSRNAPRLTEAMQACVPEGFVRVPGVGLQRQAAAS